MRVLTQHVPELGNRSYVVVDGTHAAVIDPPRHVEPIVEAVREAGAEITHVLETHVHNDYVTGGLELAWRTGATYGVSAADDVRFDRRPLHDGDSIAVGNTTIEVVATPGHTPGHLSYVARNASTPPAVFTGGSLLLGSVGRTDLSGRDRTAELALAQHASARRLASTLPRDAVVHPTHGFGSLCSSEPAADRTAATVAAQLSANPVLVEDDADAFARRLVAGFGDVPAYYRHASACNRAGPAPTPLCGPRRIATGDLAFAFSTRAAVVDMRSRRAFAREHLDRTINIELRDCFAVSLGRVVGWLEPLVLLAPTDEHALEAVRQLELIGWDDTAAVWVGGPERWPSDAVTRTWPVRSFADLKLPQPGRTVLDVRDLSERRERWVGNSHWSSIDRLARDLSMDRPGPRTTGTTWVHCASGFRASVAASLLSRAGTSVTLIDEPFEAAMRAGLALGPHALGVAT